MKSYSMFLLTAFAVILAFDALASFISQTFQINYGLFSIGSILIYIGIGFFGRKYGNLSLGIISAAITGLIEATLGWYISWVIGPGRIEGEFDWLIVFSGIIINVLTASLFGLIGGLVSYFISR